MTNIRLRAQRQFMDEYAVSHNSSSQSPSELRETREGGQDRSTLIGVGDAEYSDAVEPFNNERSAEKQERENRAYASKISGRRFLL